MDSDPRRTTKMRSRGVDFIFVFCFRGKGCMMMHKGLIVLAAAAGIWAVTKTTHLGSYAGTLWSQAKAQVKRQVPTKFEIDRARHEIHQLDKDIAGAIRPIVEFKAAVQQLDKD